MRIPSASYMVLSLMLGACAQSASPPPATVGVISVASGENTPSESNNETSEKNSPTNPSETKDKIAECNALITIINRGVDALARQSGSSADDPMEMYKSMAETVDLVANDMSRVALTDERLHRLSRDYQAMLEDVAKSARALITAFGTGESAKVKAPMESIDTAVQQEDPIVDAINQYCHAL